MGLIGIHLLIENHKIDMHMVYLENTRLRRILLVTLEMNILQDFENFLNDQLDLLL